MMLKHRFLLIGFLCLLNIYGQHSDAAIGNWETDAFGMPYFNYVGELPYSVKIPNDSLAVINEDPYFLLGNYRFKSFVHISGEYAIYSSERVPSHLNKKEKTSAKITINDEQIPLTGIHSIAGNPDKVKRNFGLGYASFEYQLPYEINLKRIFAVKPSQKINEGDSGLKLSISIRNNGNKKAKINYEELIELSFSQNTFYAKKALKYVAIPFETNKGKMVQFLITNPEVVFPLPNLEEKSIEEFYPSKYFIQSLSDDVVINQKNGEINASKEFVLKPNQEVELEFVLGNVMHDRLDEIEKIVANYEENESYVSDWKSKLQLFESEKDEELRQEMIWHNYNLEALATYSAFFDETFIPQGTMYLYSWGIRAAPRDHLQHALAACYTNPELAKSILRYTLKKSYKNGNVPFADVGFGIATSHYMFASDQELYFLMALAEYLRITKDYDFLHEAVAYYDSTDKKSVLDRAIELYSYFKTEVGTGPRGLVKLRNSDWNDLVFYKLDSKYNASFNGNESHMNTTMLVSFFDKLARQLEAASNLNQFLDNKQTLDFFVRDLYSYRTKVWDSFLKDHKDRKFSKRMYFAWKGIGVDNMFLEPQGFLMQIPEYPKERKEALYKEIKKRVLDTEKLGARQEENPELSDEFFGSRENGGFWYSLNGPLVLGLATWNLDAAWELFHRKTLKHQSATFPEYWSSYWSSFDSLDSSILPSEGLHAQQRFPSDMKVTYCAHIHAWLLYEYYVLNEYTYE